MSNKKKIKEQNKPEGKLTVIARSFNENVFPKEEIVQKISLGLKDCFDFSGINIFLLDPVSHEIEASYPDNAWPISNLEKDWLITRTKNLIGDADNESIDYSYVENRKTNLFCDKELLKRDRADYDYDCNDMLYHVLVSEEEVIFGFIQINNWQKKQRLNSDPNFQKKVSNIRTFLTEAVYALDNLYIHQKIEDLVSDKKELKQRIKKDEEDLKRRLLELSVLYETSNLLGYSLDYNQIVSLIMQALYKVLHYDVCSILLLDFAPSGEIITRINKPIKEDLTKDIQSNIIAAIMPFIKRMITAEDIRINIQKNYKDEDKIDEFKEMKSFANIPLIFREDVIGMLNVCSNSTNAFSRNEMTFLHTLANQLSSHLGRLKIVKDLERSKIKSLIQSMTEGVIMMDENNQLEIINHAACQLLELNDNTSSEEIFKILKEMNLDTTYDNSLKQGKTFIDKAVIYKEKSFSVNVSPVTDSDKNRLGTVLVLRDFTELQKINRIKTQRLETIAKVNLIIKSISDLKNLLSVLMEVILNVANADTGSIQLNISKKLLTQVHSNFPDKIRDQYKFKTGQTISEYVAKTKELCFIEDYINNKIVDNSPKILIDWYIAIPIMVKNGLLGIINIARKHSSQKQIVTQDDLNTLSTITTLSGTAIQNAIMYQETLHRQRLNQELKVANAIQNKLLPQKLPDFDRIHFGALSMPAREIGGDFYDFFPLKGGKIGIAIADIVGKGVPAGLFMAMLKSILHTNITSIESPKKAMEKINKILYKDPVVNKFIPLFYAILDPKKATLKYCNAGHEPAIVLSQGTFLALDTEGLPLGALEKSDYEEKIVTLSEADVVLFFTDGIVDARNKAGKRFGYEQLQTIIKKYAKLNSQALVNKIYAHVTKYIKNEEHLDDITLVVLKSDKSKKVDLKKISPIKVKKIRVNSSKQNIKKVRKEVNLIAQDMGFSSSDTFNLKLAVNEAQANIIEHAYQGSDKGDILFYFYIYSDRLEIIVKDFGMGTKPIPIKDENHLDELEGSGLGVYLIKTLVDNVEYKRIEKVGTELKLIKYLIKEG